MAKKNEVEIKIKSTFDNKGVEEAKRETAELSKGSGETKTPASVDNEAKTAVEELTKAKETLSRATATTKKNVKELSDSNKRLASSKREVAQATRQEESAQKESVQTKSRAKSATDQLLASQTMLNKENVRAVQRGNKLNEGLIQLSYIVDDVQYGMRGILNNIPGLVMGFGASAGLAGAISIATLAGYKLYEWLTKEDEQEKKLAEERKARNEEHAKQLKELSETTKDITKELYANEASKSYTAFLESISKELEKQTEEIREQIQLRQEQVAQANNISTLEANIAREQVELEYESGKIDKYERNRRIRDINSNLQSKIDARNLTKAQQDTLDYEKIANEQRIALGNATTNLNELKKAQADLASPEKFASLVGGYLELTKILSDDKLQKLAKKRDYTKSLIEKAKEEGWAGSWSDLMNKKALSDFNVQLAPFDNASKEVLKIQEDVNKFSSVFAQAGINFLPNLKDGKEALDSYSNSLKTFESKIDSATRSVNQYTSSLEKANKTASASRRQAEYLSTQIGLRDRLSSIRTERETIVDEKQKQEEQRKAEEKLKKERERQQKEIESKRFEEQRELARSGALEISDKERSTRKGISAIEAFEIGKAKLGESISQTDRNVSEAEMTSIFLAMQQSLNKSGQYTTKLMAFLKDEMTKLVSRINDIETQTNKELEQLKTGITRAVQQ